MRTLYVLRHAESDWVKGPQDHERPLNARGLESCALVGRSIEGAAIEPEVVLCSSALRARQTLDGIRSCLPDSTSVRIENEIYLGSVTELLTRLRALDDQIDSVMLIGHNPGLQDLIGRVAREGELLEEVAMRFPPGGMATMTFEGTWRDLEPAAGKLIAFVAPEA